MKLAANIGIPMPRFAYIPSLNSNAALLTIRSRTVSFEPAAFPSALRVIRFLKILFI
jgi:hypothetical protein